jgi:hypothetical protein
MLSAIRNPGKQRPACPRSHQPQPVGIAGGIQKKTNIYQGITEISGSPKTAFAAGRHNPKSKPMPSHPGTCRDENCTRHLSCSK